jgi:glucokinase
MASGPETAVGVDVGGTHIRAARIDRSGAVLDKRVEPVSPERAGFSAQVLRLISSVRGEACAGVGIGIPGRVDAAGQLIVSAGYLDIAGLDLPGLVSDATGLPARIENDATMALMAEAHARGGDIGGLILMLTVGTGIGGAILANGTPCYGGGISGQFGHIVVSEDGPECNCGRRGCVETFSSGTALGRIVADNGLPKTTRLEELFARAETRDPVATAVLDAWARPFQRALETLVSTTDPRLILIGGGLGAEMVRALDRMPRRSKWFGLPVEAAQLGDDAGIIGAGLCGLDLKPTAREAAR